MQSYNVGSLTVIRDRVLNLCADIQAATAEFNALREDLGNEGIAAPRKDDESDTLFLRRLATDLTVTIQKELNRQELESIMSETGLPDPDAPQPTMNLRRPVTRTGRFFNRLARLVG